MQTITTKLWLCKSVGELWRFNTTNLYFFLGLRRTTCSLPSLIERLPLKSLQVTSHDYMYFLSRVLQGCSAAGDFQTGLLVHPCLLKLNLVGVTSLWNQLLSLYCKSNQFYLARRLFDTMPRRDVVSFNTMVSSYVQRGYSHEAVHIYSKMMGDGIMPNHVTLLGLIGTATMLKALHLRGAFHAQTIRYGLNFNEFVGSSLVEGYAKLSSLDDAIKAFGEIANLDLVSCNVMIDGCTRNKNKSFALNIFLRMLRENMEYDGFTLTSIVKTCSEAKDLSCGMLLHGCAIKSGLAYETPICNSLITMYSKCEKGMTSAITIFRGILEPNIISWTATIAGFMQNGQNWEAIQFYHEMLKADVKENNFSFASILPVYSNLGNLEQGRKIHARIVKSCFSLDLLVNNALIDMYSKCGSLQDSHMVFSTMGKHDVVSFTSLITCFGQHGEGTKALEAFRKLKSEGLKPDGVTFLGCLSACSHGGLVDEGVHVFRMMIDIYSVKPRMEHFACVVDMLGRAGRLKEAEGFIKDLGIESNVLVWEALLGGCSIHGEMALGEKCAKKIIDLQPGRAEPYVSLSNIYADSGLWEDKGMVREKLGVAELKKATGCSWVALELCDRDGGFREDNNPNCRSACHKQMILSNRAG